MRNQKNAQPAGTDTTGLRPVVSDLKRSAKVYPMTASEYIQLIAMGTMLLAVVLLFVERLKSGRGLGARTIQLTSVFLIVPMILVLALQKVLSSETTATLIGALIGYVLSGIGDFRPEGKDAKKEKEAEAK